MANRTSINKSRIFKLVWKLFRRVHARYGAWQITRGIVDGSFSHALRSAWAIYNTPHRPRPAIPADAISPSDPVFPMLLIAGVFCDVLSQQNV